MVVCELILIKILKFLVKNNKTHMCVNYLAYVEYGTYLPV